MSDGYYLDEKNHWRDAKTNRWIKNLFRPRCQVNNCDRLVRSGKSFCPKHIDWTKTAHGSSILTDEDIIYLSNNYHILTDNQIAGVLWELPHHQNVHSEDSLLLAIRHHRRKYLEYRYAKKFNYKSIKKEYRKIVKSCEICQWHESSIDIHHILQIHNFENELDYYNFDNLIGLCPNHHRIVETLRSSNMLEYLIYIGKYRNINWIEV